MNKEFHSHSENDPFNPEQALLSLATSIGFSETKPMTSIRESLSPSQELADLREKVINYQTCAEQEVDTLQNETRIKAQIGLTLASAAIFHRIGLPDTFHDTLEDAITHAELKGYPEILDAILNIQEKMTQSDESSDFN